MLYVCKSREMEFINVNNLTDKIQKVKKIEKEIALNNSKKTIAFTKKWHLADNIDGLTFFILFFFPFVLFFVCFFKGFFCFVFCVHIGV